MEDVTGESPTLASRLCGGGQPVAVDLVRRPAPAPEARRARTAGARDGRGRHAGARDAVTAAARRECASGVLAGTAGGYGSSSAAGDACGARLRSAGSWVP